MNFHDGEMNQHTATMQDYSNQTAFSTKVKASLQCDGKIDSSSDNKLVTLEVANQTRFIGDNGELWCIGPPKSASNAAPPVNIRNTSLSG